MAKNIKDSQSMADTWKLSEFARLSKGKQSRLSSDLLRCEVLEASLFYFFRSQLYLGWRWGLPISSPVLPYLPQHLTRQVPIPASWVCQCTSQV